MDRQDIETRRADNQVWNGAEDYGVRSDFHAFDPEGGADLYLNTVIGLVHHYYDFRRFKPPIQHLPEPARRRAVHRPVLAGTGGAVYHRARGDRPVLDALRREYAARTVARGRNQAVRESLDNLRCAWFQRALGQPGPEDDWERGCWTPLTFPRG